MFRLKPIVGSPILSFQHFEKVVYDPVVNFSNGAKPGNNSFMDNVLLKGGYNFDLYADIYDWNSKWSFGIGIGEYGGSRTFIKLNSEQQNSKSVYGNQISMGNSSNSAATMIGPVDFNTYISLTRSLNVRINNTNYINHFVSFGLGFTKNKKVSISSEDEWGTVSYETYNSRNFFPFLLFRYEMEFLSKKGKNLFNLIASYQQGVFKVAQLSWVDTYNVGTYYSQQAHFRGSSISLGISKPFYIKRPKNKEL
jgi:hypothetical protein